MWLLDVQQAPPPLALSASIAAQQAAAASLESAAQLAAAAWRSKQHDLVSTAVGALLSQSFDSLSNGRSHPSQHQQVIPRSPQVPLHCRPEAFLQELMFILVQLSATG